ncbi:MAG: hypothetical protein QXE51_03705 [Nitrososphaeria archaeon]
MLKSKKRDKWYKNPRFTIVGIIIIIAIIVIAFFIVVVFKSYQEDLPYQSYLNACKALPASQIQSCVAEEQYIISSCVNGHDGGANGYANEPKSVWIDNCVKLESSLEEPLLNLSTK